VGVGTRAEDVVGRCPQRGAVATVVEPVDQFRHASMGAVELDQRQPELVQRGRGLHTGAVTECPAQLAEVVLGDHELVANVVVVAVGVVRMLRVGDVAGATSRRVPVRRS
jgi:hypothetical protein